VISFNCFLLC